MMEKNIKVYIDLNSIYSKSNQTYNEDYMNICIQFAKVADLVVVYSEAIEFEEVIKHINNRIKGVSFFSCDCIENIVLDEPDEKAVFVISSIYKEVKIQKNIIKLSLDFDFIQNKYLNTSFVEVAKEKLIYNLFSDDFSFLINKDTMKEFKFIQSVFQKNGLYSGKLLDCCCGVGRHDILLSKQGYEIVGIDISQNQIATARRTNKNDLIDYIVGDIRNYKPPYEYFDSAICMWTSVNYLSKKEMVVFFDNVYNGLKKSSIFILDTKNFASPIEYKLYSKKLVKNTKKIHIFVIKRIKNKVQTSKYIYFIYDTFNHETEFFVDNELINIYTQDDILDMAQSKFSIIDVYGDYDACPYDEKKSDRMILVLKKL